MNVRLLLGVFCLALLAGCAESSDGVYVASAGDRDRFMALGKNGRATIHVQGRSLPMTYRITGDRFEFSIGRESDAATIRNGCIEFPDVSYCRDHYLRAEIDTNAVVGVVTQTGTRRRDASSSAPPGAAVTSMKQDLRNVLTAQESFFADSARYAARLSQLNLQPSPGVSIVIQLQGPAGYIAQATTRGVPTTCTLQIGGGANEGQPICR